MFIRTIMKEKGMTLMSVLVATALSGIIGLIVIRLMGNQAEAMLVLKLREEREILLKHYRQVVIGGWEKTMASSANPTGENASIRDTNPDNTTHIGKDAFPLLLKENLYKHDADGWWEVSATVGTSGTAGQIKHSDAHDTHGTRGLHREQNYTVTLSVSFKPSKHPVVSANLATRRELLYMGYRWQQTRQKGCGSYDHSIQSEREGRLSRIDTRGGTPEPIYHPDFQGAVVSYSFHSNYIKCSQVPLVLKVECPKVGAMLGFESWGTGATRQRYYRTGRGYVTGRLACSYPLATTTAGSAWKAALGTERYYTLNNKVWNEAGDKNADSCSSSILDLSYVHKVTQINSSGSGGGRLTCEQTLIAPHVVTGMAVTGKSISGCTVDSEGRTNCASNISYIGWNRSTYVTFNHHAGQGGYQTNKGQGIKSIGHSGGIREFTSTGAIASGARKPHPILADNQLRGRPGNRGRNGGCDCKEDPRTLRSCQLR